MEACRLFYLTLAQDLSSCSGFKRFVGASSKEAQLCSEVISAAGGYEGDTYGETVEEVGQTKIPHDSNCA